MTKLKVLWKDKCGMSTPMTVALILCFLLIICATAEYSRLLTIVSGVRDSLQSSIISVSTGNYDDTYASLREGYSGGYVYYGDGWEESQDYGDVYNQLDRVLSLDRSGGWHYKPEGDSYEYRLKDLKIEIINAPFTPGNPNNNFEADAQITIEIPLSFGWGHLPPFTMEIRTRAGYTPKF